MNRVSVLISIGISLVFLMGSARVSIGAISDDADGNILILIEALGHPNERVREGALEALGKKGPEAKPAVPHVLKILASMDSSQDVSRRVTRRGTLWDRAVQTLTAIGLSGVPKLLDALDHDNINVVLGAACALAWMNPPSKDAVPAITKLLRSNDETRRYAAVIALRDANSVSKDALPALLEAMKTDDSTLKNFLMQAIGNIGPEASAAIPELIEHMKKRPGDTTPIIVLGKIGPAAHEAVPLIVKRATSDSSTRIAVANALGNIRANPELSVPAFSKMLTDKEERASRAAAIALGKFGPAAKSAIPELEKALRLQKLLGPPWSNGGFAEDLKKALTRIKKQD